MKNFKPDDFIRSVAGTDSERAYLALALEYCKKSPELRPCTNLIALLDTTLHEMYPDVQPASLPNAPEFPLTSRISLDIPIIDRCNLDCACCSHYAPLAKSAEPVSLEDLGASISLLSDKCQSAINQLNILGGEPLLHDQLPEIVRLVHDKFPLAQKFVVSNMLLFGKRKDELLQAMKETDTYFGYSDYGCNSSVIENAIKNSEGVPMVRFGDSPAVFHKVLKSRKPMFETSGKIRCAENTCLTLLGNRVYLCSSTPYLKYLNSAFGTSLHAGKYDYIELRNVELAAEILLFAILPNPFCRRCDTKNAEHFVPGRSSKSRTEWLMD